MADGIDRTGILLPEYGGVRGLRMSIRVGFAPIRAEDIDLPDINGIIESEAMK